MLDELQGLELEFKLELCSLTNGLQRFYLLILLLNPRIIFVEFKFFKVSSKLRN